jgi:hypothetical protein
MDRDSWSADTDNVVLVDGRRRRLVWVPRDLWSERVGDRINVAYRLGGGLLLRQVLREHGLAAEASVVLRRSAVEHALAGLRVTVPVDRTRRYWYPLSPTKRIEDGRKLVRFDPPSELLEGERLHQWAGARTSADRPPPPLPDVDRIERQQVLCRRLLEEGFPFSRALEDPALVSVSNPAALDVLAEVGPDWRFSTHTRFRPASIDGKLVLVARRRLPGRAVSAQ